MKPQKKVGFRLAYEIRLSRDVGRACDAWLRSKNLTPAPFKGSWVEQPTPTQPPQANRTDPNTEE